MRTIYESVEEIHEILLQKADDHATSTKDPGKDIISELLSIALENETVKLMLIRKLICHSTAECTTAVCPFRYVCHTSLNKHRSPDQYIAENPEEAHHIINQFLKEKGLEL